MPIESECDIFVEALEEFKKTYPYFTFNVIFTMLKVMIKDELTNNLNKFIKLKNNEKYKDLLLGFDLVGDESLVTSDTFTGTLLDFKEKHPEIVYFLHGGENYFESNTNVLVNILAQTPRIGHGINIIKHSYLFNTIKEKNICIESCPLSNQRLNYVDNLQHHPLKVYLNYGLKVCVNSDDNSLFNTTILNDDFYVCGALMNFTLLDFKQVCYNSIVYSCINKDQIEKHLKKWENDWNEYIDKVINFK